MKLKQSKSKKELKLLLAERMKMLLPDEKDFQSYLKSLESKPPRSIRCNTLKISPKKLKKKLEAKGWKIRQPFKDYLEVMIIEGKFANNKNLLGGGERLRGDWENSGQAGSRVGGEDGWLIDLEPGELGRSLEHMLGYYYVQEIASMLPVLALEPKPGQIVLDLAASPGSKTTQIAAEMTNKGTLIANEISLGRIKILASNTERCGVTNMIITKKEGASLCRNLKKLGFTFDKILIDAPCSGEGTLRSTPLTYKIWNIHTVRKLSKIQKNLVANALEILKPEGELIYSTCTHAPEENEEVVDFILKKFKREIKIEKIQLPVKCRPGIKVWNEKEYNKETQKTCRIYPQDNNTEGFFIAKIRKIK